MTILAKHIEDAETARRLYVHSLRAAEAGADWRIAVRHARRLVAQALRASAFLTDVEGALCANGAHNLVFRQLLAPPMSQDQFKLVCPTWSKSSEVNGSKVPRPKAFSVAEVIYERLDYGGTVRWSKGTKPTFRRQLSVLLRVASVLIASQQLATDRRSKLAKDQEQSIIALLCNAGWSQSPSKLIDTRAQVVPKHFMHKTRFATSTTTSQEVDIACGLPKSYVLAMECKVTNDETNSVKRVNDVLKKATSWKDHWGSFVITAALLDGVIAAKDVQRLSDAGIHVFWSHDLQSFSLWLSERMGKPTV
jgi:hypothetical protein